MSLAHGKLIDLRRGIADWFPMDFLRDQESLLAWIGGLSLLTLVVSFIVVPIVVRRMPYDYFLENDVKADEMRQQHPVLRTAVLTLKNLIGGILLLGGILMLVTPGQGLLTMVIGLMLMDFPGKRALEIRLIRIAPLKRAIDWIRERAKKRPLELPAEA